MRPKARIYTSQGEFGVQETKEEMDKRLHAALRAGDPVITARRALGGFASQADEGEITIVVGRIAVIEEVRT